jgi:hypothetical protein
VKELLGSVARIINMKVCVESGSEKFDKLQAKGNVCHPSSQNSE